VSKEPYIRWGHDRMIRYNTLYLHVFKSGRDGQPNLAHSTTTKNKEKLKKIGYLRRNGVGKRAIVHEGSLGGRSEITGDRICETGRF